MQMPKQTFYAMVNRHGGWIEGDIARFPSVAAKAAFNRECDDYASAVKEGRRFEVSKPFAGDTAAWLAAKQEG